jgi:nicotinate-nucleotide adenylyltransferase
MADKKIRTLVFGGTFNPSHKGHVSLVCEVLDAGCAERVIFVPALRPPHKTDEDHADYADRVAMLRFSIEATSSLTGRASISEIEAERIERLSYTYETMLELSLRMPDSELLLLIGADSLINLHSWYKANELVNNWSILTFPRNSFLRESPSVLNSLRENWPEAIALQLFDTILDCKILDVSSTQIRRAFANSNYQLAKHFLLPEVYEYIKLKGIYGKL